ncbi:MAG: hypothetical protein GWN79_11365, partial [Actinobacteria bacterium]|nr:hypothetical protein [Actinomycetota bacterium]
MLVDDQYALGGHLRWGGAASRAALTELEARVRASGAEVLVDSVVIGRYDHNWLGIV